MKMNRWMNRFFCFLVISISGFSGWIVALDPQASLFAEVKPVAETGGLKLPKADARSDLPRFHPRFSFSRHGR